MVSGRAAIILAAGASERMGSPKALLPWRGSTLVEHAVDQARGAGVEQIVVVVGPAIRHVELNATTVLNPAPETGRSASIRLGSAAIAAAPAAILVQSVDQPVEADVLAALFQAVEDNAEVAVPSYRGRRGHPVCFTGQLLSELREVRETDEGLRAVVRRHAVTEVPVDSETVTWNLNDPGSYAAAQAAIE
jgi:CTP:molybdopterin cytidylyltransferase MocA